MTSKLMADKRMADKSTRLIRLVEERALSKKGKKKQKENLAPYLPKECIYDILLQLPPETIHRLSYVCKPWYKMVNSSIFIDDQLNRSEMVLIFLFSVKRNRNPHSKTIVPRETSNTFSVEDGLFRSQFLPLFLQQNIEPRSDFFHIQFMEIKDGKSKIREFNVTCLGEIGATCNGLILLENKMKRGFIVLNPVTRKLIALPLGTMIYPPHQESYGLVLCKSTRQYKLIHLFEDEMGYIGCEIFILGARSWRMVDGPPFGLLTWLGCNPVSAIGALHWIPHIDGSNYLVSLTTDDEKFHQTSLPKRSGTHDGIVEMGGLLSFMTHEDTCHIDIWILSGLNGEDWIKQHSIIEGCSMKMIPLYCSRVKGEIVFKDKDGSLYAYDFESMKKIDMEHRFPIKSCYPHVNSLVSW